MHTTIRLALVALFASFAFGCAPPAPEKVCDHMVELGEKEKDKDDDDDKKSSADGKKLAKGFCTLMLVGVKAKDKDAYSCYSKCVMKASTQKEAKKCDDSCPDFEKAAKKVFGGKDKSSDDEADEPKPKKKKKKSSDDDE